MDACFCRRKHIMRVTTLRCGSCIGIHCNDLLSPLSISTSSVVAISPESFRPPPYTYHPLRFVWFDTTRNYPYFERDSLLHLVRLDALLKSESLMVYSAEAHSVADPG